MMDSRITEAPVVLMCGISGSGKTYFAHLLEQHGYRRLSADCLAWGIYGAEFAGYDPVRQREALACCNRRLDELLREALAAGERVVVDSTLCKRPRRDALRRLCAEAGVKPALVYLDCDLALLRSRMAGRKGLGPDDQIVPDSRLEMFYANFERPGDDENPIIITGQ